MELTPCHCPTLKLQWSPLLATQTLITSCALGSICACGGNNQLSFELFCHGNVPLHDPVFRCFFRPWLFAFFAPFRRPNNLASTSAKGTVGCLRRSEIISQNSRDSSRCRSSSSLNPRLTMRTTGFPFRVIKMRSCCAASTIFSVYFCNCSRVAFFHENRSSVLFPFSFRRTARTFTIAPSRSIS